MRRVLLNIAVGTVGLLGCDSGKPPTRDGSSPAPAPPASVSPEPAMVSSISLQPVTYSALEKTIESHKGKVVLVDVWSLGCPTCLKKFPSIVELTNELGPQGLVVLALNTDEPEDKTKVIDFLKSKNATTTNLIFKDTEDEEKKYDAKYPLSPQPILWVYDRAGKRVIDGGSKLMPKELREQVLQLLNQKG
ncbi:MAG: TlpA disulfide reductase family protein [Gemmataceae bacterium]